MGAIGKGNERRGESEGKSSTVGGGNNRRQVGEKNFATTAAREGTKIYGEIVRPNFSMTDSNSSLPKKILGLEAKVDGSPISRGQSCKKVIKV